MVDIAGYYDESAEPQGDFSPIPAGAYAAEIVESEIEDVSRRSNKGRCLKLTWRVADGEFANRLLWQRLNMWAENMDNLEKVLSIANQQFASIRQATGVMAPKNTEELHFRPCMLRVVVKTDPSGQYGPQNEIKGVAPIEGQGAKAQASPAPRSGPAAAPSPSQNGAPANTGRQPAMAGGGSAPWRR